MCLILLAFVFLSFVSGALVAGRSSWLGLRLQVQPGLYGAVRGEICRCLRRRGHDISFNCAVVSQSRLWWRSRSVVTFRWKLLLARLRVRVVMGRRVMWQVCVLLGVLGGWSFFVWGCARCCGGHIDGGSRFSFGLVLCSE